jgi:hypothetical protein
MKQISKVIEMGLQKEYKTEGENEHTAKTARQEPT